MCRFMPRKYYFFIFTNYLMKTTLYAYEIQKAPLTWETLLRNRSSKAFNGGGITVCRNGVRPMTLPSTLATNATSASSTPLLWSMVVVKSNRWYKLSAVTKWSLKTMWSKMCYVFTSLYTNSKNSAHCYFFRITANLLYPSLKMDEKSTCNVRSWTF